MKWTLQFNSHVSKKIEQLPERVQLILALLINDLEKNGSYPGPQWRNFSKLHHPQNAYHCHLAKGKPTYVACWKVIDKKSRIMEVYYVGTHENAPY